MIKLALKILLLVAIRSFSTSIHSYLGRDDIPAPPRSEVHALIEFCHILNCEENLKWNLSQDDDPCRDGWEGIKCSTDGKTKTHIHYVDIGGKGLKGPLHEALSVLQALPYLQFLAVYDNHLTGSIPNLLLPRLKLFRIDDNELLMGTLPLGLEGYKSLEYFDAHSTNITGSLPVAIGALSHLENLYLFNCSFTGTLPRELGQLPKLQNLRLDNNILTGEIPSWGALEGLDKLDEEINHLQLMQSIEYIDLNNNRLTGTIPKTLGTLESLVEVHLYSNILSGTLPSEIGNLSNLRALRLDDNKLTGRIPVEYAKLTGLEFLGLGKNNRLSGTLPDYAADLRNKTAMGRSCSRQLQRINSTEAYDFVETEMDDLDYDMLAALQLANKIIFTNKTSNY
jgi:hypothetical protein